MDKNSVRGYAIWARKELISRVTQKALQYGITKEEVDPIDADSVSGRLLTATEKKQRIELIKKIERNGFNQVIEEVAYTWFNRFTALRFMEVNGYLPSYVRVFTDQNNAFKPQILDEALSLNIVGLDMAKVYAYKESSETDELYKYLLITQCNALNEVLPRMFQQISDYTELLFPDNLLREGSVIEKLIMLIPEKDFNVESAEGQVEILGWLFQYYNEEKQDKVNNMYKTVIPKEDVPAATQLFTTDWVVRYLVDNSLGRYWIERNKESKLINRLDYFVIPEDLKDFYVEESIRPEELTVFDPCVGSGHFLVYAFDVLMDIYVEQGYSKRSAVVSIVKNNLYGLDLDERATQISYFAIIMKSLQYDRRFLSRNIKPNIYVIEESNHINNFEIDHFCLDNESLGEDLSLLIDTMRDAKELGSIIQVPKKIDFNSLLDRLDELASKDDYYSETTITSLYNVIKTAEVLNRKYTVVVTNPPYFNKYSSNLRKYVRRNYKEYWRDLFSVFMYRNFFFCVKGGYTGFMTPNVWMFIQSYEKLREYILKNKSICTLVLMAKGAFFKDATVDVCAFVIQNQQKNLKGTYYRLEKYKGDMEVQRKNFIKILNQKDESCVYERDRDFFYRIPTSSLAFWASQGVLRAFQEGELIGNLLDVRQGLATADNNRFLRLWYELDNNKCKYDSVSSEDLLKSKKKWVPYNKGGQRRQWYGNYDYMVNWENEGSEIKNFKDSTGKQRSVIRNPEKYFKEAITWGLITTGGFSIRYRTHGGIHDVSGMSAFTREQDLLKYILGLMGSKVSNHIFEMLNPTINLQVGDFANFPVLNINNELKQAVVDISDKSIQLAKHDWDLYETSWDFIRNPMIPAHSNVKLESIYLSYKSETNTRFEELKSKEEELNRIFIQAYELESDLSPELSDRNITITKIFDYKEDIDEEIKNNIFVRTKRDIIIDLLSYAVGCMFGRYSLDEDGLVYAGGDWDSSRYISFPADKDNIIPICDDEYFEDDIVGKFVKFIEVAYGKETLEENLSFIADALEGKGSSREVIRNYFINHFYSDHCKKYSVRGSGKRPIYWQFDSGKQNGFKCLIYMHRYKEDTIARIRTDYVHEQQARYRTSIEDLERQISHASKSERVSLTRRLQKIQSQAKEVHKYEEKIHHLADQMIKIDLDDGVKHNYKLFKDVLAKI